MTVTRRSLGGNSPFSAHGPALSAGCPTDASCEPSAAVPAFLCLCSPIRAPGHRPQVTCKPTIYCSPVVSGSLTDIEKLYHIFCTQVPQKIPLQSCRHLRGRGHGGQRPGLSPSATTCHCPVRAIGRTLDKSRGSKRSGCAGERELNNLVTGVSSGDKIQMRFSNPLSFTPSC